MEGPSRIYLIYQNVLYHEVEDSGEYAQTYYEALNQDLLTQKYRRSPRKSIGGHLAKVSGVTSQKYRGSPRKSIGGHLAKVSAVTSQKCRGSPRKSIGGHLAKVSGVTSQYILWSGSLWYPGRSSILKNKRIFLLVISELMPAFSTVQLDAGKNHIN